MDIDFVAPPLTVGDLLQGWLPPLPTGGRSRYINNEGPRTRERLGDTEYVSPNIENWPEFKFAEANLARGVSVRMMTDQGFSVTQSGRALRHLSRTGRARKATVYYVPDKAMIADNAPPMVQNIFDALAHKPIPTCAIGSLGSHPSVIEACARRMRAAGVIDAEIRWGDF